VLDNIIVLHLLHAPGGCRSHITPEHLATNIQLTVRIRYISLVAIRTLGPVEIRDELHAAALMASTSPQSLVIVIHYCDAFRHSANTPIYHLPPPLFATTLEPNDIRPPRKVRDGRHPLSWCTGWVRRKWGAMVV
jgi:hypothetical protein